MGYFQFPGDEKRLHPADVETEARRSQWTHLPRQQWPERCFATGFNPTESTKRGRVAATFGAWPHQPRSLRNLQVETLTSTPHRGWSRVCSRRRLAPGGSSAALRPRWSPHAPRRWEPRLPFPIRSPLIHTGLPPAARGSLPLGSTALLFLINLPLDLSGPLDTTHSPGGW